MKKLLPFLAASFLFACNNEAPSGQTTGRDSSSVISPGVPPAPDGTAVDSSAQPGAVPDTLQNHINQPTRLKKKSHLKTVSPKTKLDSVAILENRKLPLGNEKP